MSNYYQKQSSKVAIMSVLVGKGWKIYGFTPDQSDMMTDYWSPAHWDGVAEKNGFVLLVDQHDTHYSSYEVKKYNYNVKGTSADNYKKIQKLQATMNDAAATENEKEVCKRKIEALEGKEPNKPSYTVEQTYPTFSFANPKSCTWHIEKDGEIIAKGKGLTTVYECNDREQTKRNAESFVNKVESKINSFDSLVPVKQEVIKTVIKPVEVTDRQTIQEGDVLSFDYHGHFWKVISVYTRKDGKVCATYELLGSEKRGYQQLTNGKRYYDYMITLEKSVQEGKVKIHTLQEVKEVAYKTVYKKSTRKGQEENLLAGEVVEEVAATQEVIEQEEAVIMEEDTNQGTNGTTYTTGTGSKGNGIEITFSSKPSEEVRTAMKAIDYRWGGKNRPSIWWAVSNDKRLELAKQLAGEVTPENDYNSQDEISPDNFTTEEETEAQEQKGSSYSELEIDKFLDVSTSFVDEVEAHNYSTMNHEQKNKYLHLLNEYIDKEDYDIEILLSHIPMYSLLCEALEDIKKGTVFEDTQEAPITEKTPYDNEVKETSTGYYCHFKAWFLEVDRIESVLNEYNIPHYETGDKFIFEGVTLRDLTLIQTINKENGSILFDDSYYDSETIEQAENIQPHITDNAYNRTDSLDLQYFANDTMDTIDILNAFDDIDLTQGNNSIITEEDREHCEQLEQQFNDFKTIYELTLAQLEINQENNKYIEEYQDIKPITTRIEKAKNSFLNDVLNYFKTKYLIDIDYWELEKKYTNKPITLDTIVDEVILLLDGLTFTELEAQQVTDTMKENVRHNKSEVKNDKISIPSFLWVSSESYSSTTKFNLSYGQYDKVTALFKAIAHFNNAEYKQFDKLERTIKHEYNEDVFCIHELNLDKIESIKLYKNGKIDIVFNGSQYARAFYNQYLQK